MKISLLEAETHNFSFIFWFNSFILSSNYVKPFNLFLSLVYYISHVTNLFLHFSISSRSNYFLLFFIFSLNAQNNYIEVSSALTFNLIQFFISNILIELSQIFKTPKISYEFRFYKVWLNGFKTIENSGLLSKINFKNKQDIIYPCLALIKGSNLVFSALFVKNSIFLLLMCWKSFLCIFKLASSSKRSQPNFYIYIICLMSEI